MGYGHGLWAADQKLPIINKPTNKIIGLFPKKLSPAFQPFSCCALLYIPRD